MADAEVERVGGVGLAARQRDPVARVVRLEEQRPPDLDRQGGACRLAIAVVVAAGIGAETGDHAPGADSSSTRRVTWSSHTRRSATACRRSRTAPTERRTRGCRCTRTLDVSWRCTLASNCWLRESTRRRDSRSIEIGLEEHLADARPFRPRRPAALARVDADVGPRDEAHLGVEPLADVRYWKAVVESIVLVAEIGDSGDIAALSSAAAPRPATTSSRAGRSSSPPARARSRRRRRWSGCSRR